MTQIFKISLLSFLGILIFIIMLLIAVAYFTLLERKILASIQRRRGPNVIGFYGLLQPLADGLKLLIKETVRPSSIDKNLFILAPALSFILSIIGWVFVPFGISFYYRYDNSNIAILYFLAISSIAVIAIVLAGWSSNSKYAFLGALRSASQMLCYEVAMGLSILPLVLSTGSLGVHAIISNQTSYYWNIFTFFPAFCVFFICVVAETNRHPFDLPEAEAELVAGYNVEYSGMGFALFFLAEYANILLMCAMLSILFLGGPAPIFPTLIYADWYIPFLFGLKITFFAVIFIIIRAYLPRFRPDQLMFLGWKVLLPFSFAYFIFNLSIYFSFLIPFQIPSNSTHELIFNLFYYAEPLNNSLYFESLSELKRNFLIKHPSVFTKIYYEKYLQIKNNQIMQNFEPQVELISTNANKVDPSKMFKHLDQILALSAKVFGDQTRYEFYQEMMKEDPNHFQLHFDFEFEMATSKK